MPLDHISTAKQLEQDATILRTIRNRYCSTTGSKRACQDIIENTLGLADWHRQQAAEQKERAALLAEIDNKDALAELHKAAERTLQPTS